MKGGLIRQIKWKHLCGRTTGERGLSSLKLRDANVPILVIEVFQSQQSVSWQQYRVIDGFELLLHWSNGGDSTKNICCPSKFALCDSTKLNAHVLNYPSVYLLFPGADRLRQLSENTTYFRRKLREMNFIFQLSTTGFRINVMQGGMDAFSSKSLKINLYHFYFTRLQVSKQQR